MVLTIATDEGMLRHFGVADDARFRAWRSVTPVALPEHARRRWIDPARPATDVKSGAERSTEEAHAAGGVVQALRHAGVQACAETIRVQREPFEGKGERVEAFAAGTRFTNQRLWHVEVEVDAPIAGPLVIGDGRFLGLGVMAPVQRSRGIFVFLIEDGLAGTSQPTVLAGALRRAVLARLYEALGKRTRLPAFFTGHEADGAPSRGGHAHLSFALDPVGARLLVLAPHVFEQRSPNGEERGRLVELDLALANLGELRAGSAGLLTLRASPIDVERDPVFAPSTAWETLTPYQVTRHSRHVSATEAVARDLADECRRHGLPTPRVTVTEAWGVAGIGLLGRARLAFDVAVPGPILLGKTRHLGGGLFGPSRR